MGTRQTFSHELSSATPSQHAQKWITAALERLLNLVEGARPQEGMITNDYYAG